MRAIMPGYVNYKYNRDDGSIHSHTKSSFQKYNILTIHGIIAKNAFLLMRQVNSHDCSLPHSVYNLFETNGPSFSHSPDYRSHQEWYEKYNSKNFRTSCFFKGPLLEISEENFHIQSLTIANPNTYKRSLKSFLIHDQSKGETDQWPTFLLNNIKGLRKSIR